MTQFLCTYLLPIRRTQILAHEVREFRAYFQTLSEIGCEVIIIDGSSSSVYEYHKCEWDSVSRHIAVDPKYTYLNGKVNGIHTGVDAASCEKIIIADDDIRYTPLDILKTCSMLEHNDLVRPQNYISPLPVWAMMESARMLFNRAFLASGDYPGTCAVRRSTFLRIGHYDGDVLFDNEELVRHFAVHHAKIEYATGFFIRKKPPVLKKWLEQRPRQAYEDFVMRLKTLFFLLLPIAVLTAVATSLGTLVLLSLTAFSIVICAAGLKNKAYKYIPAWTCFFAPVWLIERSISAYLAIYWRIVYKGYPFGEKILVKGTGREWIAGGRLQSRFRSQVS